MGTQRLTLFCGESWRHTVWSWRNKEDIGGKCATIIAKLKALNEADGWIESGGTAQCQDRFPLPIMFPNSLCPPLSVGFCLNPKELWVIQSEVRDLLFGSLPMYPPLGSCQRHWVFCLTLCEIHNPRSITWSSFYLNFWAFVKTHRNCKTCSVRSEICNPAF